MTMYRGQYKQTTDLLPLQRQMIRMPDEPDVQTKEVAEASSQTYTTNLEMQMVEKKFKQLSEQL